SKFLLHHAYLCNCDKIKTQHPTVFDFRINVVFTLQENIVLDCCVSCDDRCRNRVTREQLLAVRGSNQRSAEHRHMISSDVRETKRLIQAAAEKSFGGSFNVICSNGSFSFITHTEKYCQASGAGIVCYAFKAD
ncbi:unnamed protein product, partial [Thelazia callipaeda]|uniref:Ground-like domain-containing protein n=1 Tax=Thelazia callipaeda TaxID=103827 RepID=A0A0N5CV24_THECL